MGIWVEEEGREILGVVDLMREFNLRVASHGVSAMWFCRCKSEPCSLLQQCFPLVT